MTHAQPVTPSEPRRLRVPLGDLGLAPENLRYAEPADAGVPRLADTLAAAGLIYPLVVRRGRKGEQPFMVLDGRRRRFALLLRAERGEIGLETEVDCLLAEGRARQAAAAVLTNSERAPVHPADVILAIGRMRAARVTTAAIAGALGYDPLEVRRLEALARVHPDALDAIRDGALTLSGLRLLARLRDRARQAELAEAARQGAMPAWRLEAEVRGDRVTVEDPRLRLVGRDAYAEAGGRFDSDLFGELPDVVRDAALLDRLWRGRAEALAAGLAAAGLAVVLGPDRWSVPEAFEPLAWVHVASLAQDARAAHDAALAQAEAVAARLQAGPAAPPADDDLAAWLDVQLALARAKRPGEPLDAVLLSPDGDPGLLPTFLRRPRALGPGPDADDGPEASEGAGAAAPAWTPEPPDVAAADVRVDVRGVTNALHDARTDLATRGLIRAVADHPDAALVALTAQLFRLMALNDPVRRDDSALTVEARRYGHPKVPAVEALDGEVRRRLTARRTAYLESGRRPIAWVAGLAADARLALLAELVALSLDLYEPRTAQVRRAARAEAAEIAGLCGTDLADLWTPDTAFLLVHSKAQLLAMLEAVGVEDPDAPRLRKTELATRVADAAAERRWVPPEVRWDTGGGDDPAPAADPAEAVDEVAPDARPAAGRAADESPPAAEAA